MEKDIIITESDEEILEYLDYKNEVIEEISKIARRQGIETLVVIVHDQDELSFWMNQNFIVDNSKSDLEKTIILKKQIIEISRQTTVFIFTMYPSLYNKSLTS